VSNSFVEVYTSVSVGEAVAQGCQVASAGYRFGVAEYGFGEQKS